MTQTDRHDDPRLLDAAREYLTALEAGRTPKREKYLQRYPDLADVLNECLDGIELAHGAGKIFRAPPPMVEPAPESLGEPLGDFRIVREIGRGGMGIVYEAHQISLGRRVALKVLPFASGLDPKQLQRFRTEAHAAAQLHHSNIVPVYAVGCERGMHFYAMQMIAGRPLDAVIRERRGEPHGDTTVNWKAGSTRPGASELLVTSRGTSSGETHRAIARISEQIARALEYAHDCGVVHRDIKPANLLLDGKANVWVTDFGLAHVSDDLGQTRTGDIFGTLRYMSPEQAAGRRTEIDHRTDIYSLGATLYEVLALRPLFPGTDRQRVLHAILHDEPKPLRAHDRSIPVELETIVLKAVAKSPSDRYRTAGAMADDLRRFLDDRPITARRPTIVDRTRKWARRHPAYIRAGIAFLVFSVVVLAATTAKIASEQSRTKAAYQAEKLRAEEAEARFQLAKRSADEMIAIANEELGENPQMQAIRKRLLESALAFYQEFLDQRRDDPTAQAELEQTRTRVQSILGDLAVIQGAWRHMLLKMPEVQDELKLNTDQRERTRTLVSEIEPRGDRFGEMMKMDREGRDASIIEQMRRHDREIGQILNVVQRMRFEQIALQCQGVFAFRETVVIEKLKLTAEQREKLRMLESDAMPGFNEFVRGNGPGAGGPRPGGPGGHGGGPGGFRGDGPGPSGNRAMEQALAVLTPVQQKLWQELIGPKFAGFRKNFGPPRGGPQGFSLLRSQGDFA